MAGRLDKSIGFNLIGRDVSASKTLKKVGKQAGSTRAEFAKLGRIAVGAFVAAGAAAATYATRIAIDGVKAAIEDEKAQTRLATTLRNVTKANKAQIAAVNEYIDTTQLAVGVADDELRPSLDRLLRSTGNITKAQKLQALALNIAAGTGRDLGSVTEALAKGYDGNLGALRRIGVALPQSVLKSKNFAKAQEVLNKTFKDQAAILAESSEYRLKRLNIAYDEIKETIGYALLPYLGKLATWLSTTGVQAIDAFVKGLTGDTSIVGATRSAGARVDDFRTKKLSPMEQSAYDAGLAFRSLGDTVVRLTARGGGLGPDSGIIKFFESANTFAANVEKIVNGFKKIEGAIDKADAALAQRFPWLAIIGATGEQQKKSSTTKGKKALGGPVSSGTYLVGERGPELLRMGAGKTGYVTPRLGNSANNITVNVQGSVVTQKDLSKAIRDDIAQLMRRQGATTAVLGVGR